MCLVTWFCGGQGEVGISAFPTSVPSLPEVPPPASSCSRPEITSFFWRNSASCQFPWEPHPPNSTVYNTFLPINLFELFIVGETEAQRQGLTQSYNYQSSSILRCPFTFQYLWNAAHPTITADHSFIGSILSFLVPCQIMCILQQWPLGFDGIWQQVAESRLTSWLLLAHVRWRTGS